MAGAGGVTPLNLLAAVAAIQTPVDAKTVVDTAHKAERKAPAS